MNTLENMTLKDKIFWGSVGAAWFSGNIIVYLLMSALLGANGTFTLFHPWWFFVQFLINIILVACILMAVTSEEF